MAAPARKDSGRMAATEALIAALETPKGGFTAEARAGALARLARNRPAAAARRILEMDGSSLADGRPEALPAAVFRAEESPVFGEIDCVKVVFVDGVFDADGLGRFVACRGRICSSGRSGAGRTFTGRKTFTARSKRAASRRSLGRLPR